MANWRATGDIWSRDVNSIVIATRGERLALLRFVFTTENQPPEGFSATALAIVEINDDNRFAVFVVFDLDDVAAAFENSTPGTSPAKRPPTRIHGRSLRTPAPRSTDTNYPSGHRTGSTSITGAEQRSRPAR